MGFGAWGLIGFLGFWVWGFGVRGLGFRVRRLLGGPNPSTLNPGFACRLWARGLSCKGYRFYGLKGEGLWVKGYGLFDVLLGGSEDLVSPYLTELYVG